MSQRFALPRLGERRDKSEAHTNDADGTGKLSDSEARPYPSTRLANCYLQLTRSSAFRICTPLGWTPLILRNVGMITSRR